MSVSKNLFPKQEFKVRTSVLLDHEKQNLMKSKQVLLLHQAQVNDRMKHKEQLENKYQGALDQDTDGYLLHAVTDDDLLELVKLVKSKIVTCPIKETDRYELVNFIK